MISQINSVFVATGLAIHPSKIHGLGCFATIHFARGTKITDYLGEMITIREAALRRRNGLGDCICDLDDGKCIDGRIGGNGTQYLNHSCDPNCGLIIAKGVIAIYALFDLSPGDELTVNYLTSLDLAVLPCNCQFCFRRRSLVK